MFIGHNFSKVNFIYWVNKKMNSFSKKLFSKFQSNTITGKSCTFAVKAKAHMLWFGSGGKILLSRLTLFSFNFISFSINLKYNKYQKCNPLFDHHDYKYSYCLCTSINHYGIYLQVNYRQLPFKSFSINWT